MRKDGFAPSDVLAIGGVSVAGDAFDGCLMRSHVARHFGSQVQYRVPMGANVLSFHGLSPFTGTSLDVTLHNLGVTTVIATGFSINIGIFGLLLEAVNLGYSAVLPTDCVGGIPQDYAQAVVDNSLALLATRTTADDLIALWS